MRFGFKKTSTWLALCGEFSAGPPAVALQIGRFAFARATANAPAFALERGESEGWSG
jgi:hypothetical protein